MVVWSQDIPGRPSSSLKMRAGQELEEGERGRATSPSMQRSQLDSSLGIARCGARGLPRSTCPARLATGLFLWQGYALNRCARVVLLRRIDESELPSDVFDRLHINASSSFILKNTEKVELDESKPFCERRSPDQPCLDRPTLWARVSWLTCWLVRVRRRGRLGAERNARDVGRAAE